MARMPRLTPRKTPQQGRSRALVDAIVEATKRIVLEQGTDGVTIAEIGRVAGVSPGSLYQYFPSKESVVAALYVSTLESQVDFLADNLLELRDADAAEVARVLAAVWMQLERDDGELLAKLEAFGRDSGADAKLAPVLAERARVLAAFFTNAPFPVEDPPAAAEVVPAILAGAARALRALDVARLDDGAEAERLGHALRAYFVADVPAG